VVVTERPEHPTPAAPVLEIDTEHVDGGVRVLLRGELDLTGVDDVAAAIRRLSSRFDADQIVLDLSALDFIDLQGLDVLRRLAHMCRATGKLTLEQPPKVLDVLLDLTDARQHFVVEGSR